VLNAVLARSADRSNTIFFTNHSIHIFRFLFVIYNKHTEVLLVNFFHVPWTD
jgi:hypothetical protein